MKANRKMESERRGEGSASPCVHVRNLPPSLPPYLFHSLSLPLILRVVTHRICAAPRPAPSGSDSAPPPRPPAPCPFLRAAALQPPSAASPPSLPSFPLRPTPSPSSSPSSSSSSSPSPSPSDSPHSSPLSGAGCRARPGQPASGSGLSGPGPVRARPGQPCRGQRGQGEEERREGEPQ